MLQTVLKQFDRHVFPLFSSLSLPSIAHSQIRNTLLIDCRELQMTMSDSQLIGALASQTGYWPVFTFLQSVNNLIDLASVGLIGQKSVSILSFISHYLIVENLCPSRPEQLTY